MCCFRLLHETISLQFEYKDSANRRQCKIKVPKLLFLLNFRRKGKLKKLKKLRKLRKLKTYVKAQKFPKGSEKTIVFNFFNFFNFLNFLELSICETYVTFIL